MSTQRRLNAVRLWSLLGVLPFLADLVYPPWLKNSSLNIGGGRALIWDAPFMSQGIALGQWAVELGVALVMAVAVIGVVFYVTPKWREKSSSAETGSDPPKEN